MKKIKTLSLIAISATVGAIAMHYQDARTVASILNSDDLNITRNVEQANALLDLYQDSLKANGKQLK